MDFGTDGKQYGITAAAAAEIGGADVSNREYTEAGSSLFQYYFG